MPAQQPEQITAETAPAGWSITSRDTHVAIVDVHTISFITIDPDLSGAFEFVVTARGGKKALVIRDGQHDYVFTEA